MELAIAAACFGITIVGLYTLAIHRQLYKLSEILKVKYKKDLQMSIKI
jgi:hypothetical protein